MSSVLDSVISLGRPWAYVLVGVLAALESSAFVGLFVPGELALLAGGYVVYRGEAGMAVMMLVAAVGAVVGDSIGYEIGRHFGGRLRVSRLGSKVGEERWARADASLAAHGGRAVFFGRFIGVLRALVPAMAGALRMPYRKFLAWNALGAVIWAPGLVLIGYAAGSSYRRVGHYAGQAGLLLAIAAAVVIGILAAARWVARHPSELRAFGDRLAGLRPARYVRSRHRRRLDFVIRRLRPGQALGLSLTLELGLLGLLGWAFGAVLENVLGRGSLTSVDGPITRYVVGHRTAWLTTAMRAATMLGSSAFLVPLVLVVGLAAYRRGRGWSTLGVLAGAQAGAIVLYDVIKPLVGRPRPAVGPLVATATGFAFPSGHATQSAAVLGALAWIVAKSAPAWRTKVAAWATAAIAILIVGLSRVYLGVHWASDVVGGYVLGALWLAALLTTIRTVGEVRSRPSARNGVATGGPVRPVGGQGDSSTLGG